MVELGTRSGLLQTASLFRIPVIACHSSHCLSPRPPGWRAPGPLCSLWAPGPVLPQPATVLPVQTPLPALGETPLPRAYKDLRGLGADPRSVSPDENERQVAVLWLQVNSWPHITVVQGLPIGLFSSCPRESWRTPMVSAAKRTRGSGLFRGAEGSGCPLRSCTQVGTFLYVDPECRVWEMFMFLAWTPSSR